MSLQCKAIVSLRISEDTSLWVTEIDGAPQSPAVEIVLTEGLWYVTDDVTDPADLLAMIEAAFVTATVTSSPGVSKVAFSANDTSGKVSHVARTGSVKLHWGDPDANGRSAEYVKAWLRFENFSDPYLVGTVTPLVGYRVHVGGFYPRHYLIDDVASRAINAAQFVPDLGNVQTLHVSSRLEHALTFRTEGFPRDPGYTEYHDLDAWWQEAATGRPFRLYPDKTELDPYEPADRLGWQAFVLGTAPFTPQPENPAWYKHHRYSFQAFAYE